MGKRLILSLRNQPCGKETTPWLDEHRERFAKAAKAASQELKGKNLKGANKVRAFNALVSEKLKNS